MTWEELNKKYDYDFNRLILCMPDDVQKDITEAWGGGELNPYKAAERVLEQRKISDREVDLDIVAQKYEEKFSWKPHERKPNRKSFADFERELGEKTANRAEVLAAMDCLMHHLKCEDHFKQWTEEFKDERNWNILDWDPGEGACRTEDYMLAAAGLGDYDFENLVMTFATIVSVACFSRMYHEGAFSFESGPKKKGAKGG